MKHGYLIDMDGVLYRGSEVIPGAAYFIQQLRERAIPFRFLTNNSQRTRRDVAMKLERLGVEVEEEHIFTCAMATAILGRDGIAVGTVSIAGPTSRFTPERMKEMAPDLAATVGEIADLWPARHVLDFVSGNALKKSANA